MYKSIDTTELKRIKKKYIIFSDILDAIKKKNTRFYRIIGDAATAWAEALPNPPGML